MKKILRLVASQKAIDDCDKFAERVYNTNKAEYARRGQSNKESCVKQNKAGKLAEKAVHAKLKRRKINCTEPDFNIYPASSKKHGADLIADGKYKLHIKCQDSKQAAKYRFSFLFQTDYLKRFKATVTDKDYMVLCKWDEETKTVSIYGCVPFKTLFDKELFDLPQKVSLRNNKRAVYWKRVAAVLPRDERTKLIWG